VLRRALQQGHRVAPPRSAAERLLWPAVLTSLGGLLLAVVLDGYRARLPGLRSLTEAVLALGLAITVVRDIAELGGSLDRLAALRKQAAGWVLLALVIFTVLSAGQGLLLRLVVSLRQTAISLQLLGRTRAGSLLRDFLVRHPAHLMLLSFGAVILLGAVALTFPAATADSRGATFLEAVFTATSATCVTGLIVRDTATYFTFFGQLIILALIQVGGLGIMTLSASAAVLMGRRLGLRGRSLMADVLESSDLEAVQGLTAYVVKLTLLIEAAGALILSLRFAVDMPAQRAVYFGLFHSISAFCNAGFSAFSDSLVSYRGDLLVNLVICVLIVLGGLGFMVIAALVRRDWRRRGLSFWAGSSVHVKLVVPVTALLIALGAIAYYFVEYNHTLAGLPLSEKLLGSLFASVTARTAGFNTVNTAAMGGAGVLLVALLMFIGGSPGGTAGGIKTTTTAVLVLSVKAMLQGREEVEAFGRAVPRSVVYKASAITVLSALLVVVLFAVLLQTDAQGFDRLLFETVSAFGTVGLSMDVTPALSTAGKLIVTLLMFVGRTGPLTLAVAIGERPRRGHYSLPSDNVLVG
jgi:trk system potassium uptake protein TrkH